MAKTVKTCPQGSQQLGDRLSVDNVEEVQYRRVDAGLRRQRGGEAPPRTLAGSLPKRSEGGPCGRRGNGLDVAGQRVGATYPDVEGDAGPSAGGFPLLPCEADRNRDYFNP